MAIPGAGSGTILSPQGTTGLNRTNYDAKFFRTTYQRKIFIPIIENAERLYGGNVLRKEARVAAAALAQGSDGTGVNYVNPVGSPVTVSPGGYVVPIAWSRNEDAQVDFEMYRIAADAASDSMAEGLESVAFALIQSATQVITNPNLDATTLRTAVALLDKNTNGVSGPSPDGGGKTIYGLFSSTQRVALQNIPEVNSAEARGDSENPYVKGVWVRGFGIMANLSTVVAQDANGYHNAVCLAEAFTWRWNERTNISRQEYEYRKGAYAFANAGGALVYDNRVVAIRTT